VKTPLQTGCWALANCFDKGSCDLARGLVPSCELQLSGTEDISDRMTGSQEQIANEESLLSKQIKKKKFYIIFMNVHVSRL
jgi:hypothetical protein